MVRITDKDVASLFWRRPRYPAHWEADIALRDGSAAHLRPIRPNDADKLQSFHKRQSPESVYFRFFAPMAELSPRDLKKFTVVDYHDRVALIVLIGEDIVGVGRYDRSGPQEAEVAFNIADAFQGRGLGSILLEHLVAAARERGIRRFNAEVLPTNHRMLAVFTDAGFDIQRTIDDGVVLVSFAIDPTERSTAVMTEREQWAEAQATKRLLRPRSIVVVGASRRPRALGRRILDNIEASGFEGPVYAVNPEAFEVDGRTSYARVTELPGPADLAIVAVRADQCLSVINDCAAHGVQSVIVLSGGFADDGYDGARLQRDLVCAARAHGIRLLGPASIGLLTTSPDHPLNASLAPRMPKPGRLALAGQSSALSVQLLAGVDRRGLGFATFVSAGNRADVSLNDCLQFWDDDPDVEVIGLVMESMGNPRKFTRIARRLTRHKPVAVLRPLSSSITTPPGHQVRSSRLSRRALDQVLASSGVVQCETMERLLDTLEFFSSQTVPSGGRLGLLSNQGALATVMRGVARHAGLTVVRANADIPVVADLRRIRRSFDDMLSGGDLDLVVAAFLDPVTGDLSDQVEEMVRASERHGIPIALSLITDPVQFDAIRKRFGAKVPIYDSAVRAMNAAADAVHFGRHRAAQTAPREHRDDVNPEGVRRLVAKALDVSKGRPARMQPEYAHKLLSRYGLDVMPSRMVTTFDEAREAAMELGFPVALKSSDPVLRHRPDLGGVRLDIPDVVHLRHAFEGMRRDLAFSQAPYEVQRMAPPGVPVVIRSVEDPSLGPVISFSLAGDATDLLDDIAYAIPPLSRDDVDALLRAPATARRLGAYRGLPALDRDALAEVVVRVGLLAEAFPEIRELELYPVIVSQRGVSIVSAHVEVATPLNRVDSPRRTLLSMSERD
ncbi:bifunctional acetate--CoA ligase family protein/GNAT family N-acetyltransferase [Devriesea agamarum]|uniref:bifunctional acetate--CoA ligase family protein/GNAT family N-acetyltransferase n=1 Tax=Devriesea agamarum TaxID=472569 RepID=UPI00071D164D|nr:GNAT family N-acetyltransferase [Devriesea agamarum]